MLQASAALAEQTNSWACCFLIYKRAARCRLGDCNSSTMQDQAENREFESKLGNLVA